MYKFVHRNYDPLLEFVDKLADMPEFEEIRRKVFNKKTENV